MKPCKTFLNNQVSKFTFCSINNKYEKYMTFKQNNNLNKEIFSSDIFDIIKKGQLSDVDTKLLSKDLTSNFTNKENSEVISNLMKELHQKNLNLYLKLHNNYFCNEKVNKLYIHNTILAYLRLNKNKKAFFYMKNVSTDNKLYFNSLVSLAFKLKNELSNFQQELEFKTKSEKTKKTNSEIILTGKTQNSNNKIEKEENENNEKLEKDLIICDSKNTELKVNLPEKDVKFQNNEKKPTIKTLTEKEVLEKNINNINKKLKIIKDYVKANYSDQYFKLLINILQFRKFKTSIPKKKSDEIITDNLENSNDTCVIQ